MDKDAIIREWFFRLPKGYANAPYSKEEMNVLHKVLEENGLNGSIFVKEVDQLDQAFHDAKPVEDEEVVNIREALVQIGDKRYQLNKAEIDSQKTNDFSKKLKKLKSALLQVASKNILITFPGLTHLQTAQPISVGHFFMAYFEMFNRDTNRFSDSFRRMNENPLGAGALAGTNFPINRNKTTKMLDFKKPTKNSLDTVSDRDFVVDFLSSSSLMAVHLSRLAEEITLYNSDLVGFFKIGDQLMSSSSIMPQKKNPDGAELIRAKSSTISGNLSSMLNLLKSLPLTYSKDLQEDKALVTSTSKNIHLCLDCMIEIISTIKIEKSNIEKKLKSSFANATDLADWLVINLGYSFRSAHNLTAKIVNFAEKKKISLNKISMKDYKKFDKNIDKSVYGFLDLKNSINNKKSYGGTAISEIRKMISQARKELSNEKY